MIPTHGRMRVSRHTRFSYFATSSSYFEQPLLEFVSNGQCLGAANEIGDGPRGSTV